ncbi:MAG: cytochrome c-type biogenesis protein CcmH [Chloroflexi bacterium]|nr:cytochrome c-type biogenesis protein CcmH [Chloroflexota bacterium]
MNLATRALFLSLLLSTLFAPVAAAISPQDITSELMCQCGCTMIVASCDCGTAAQMTDVVKQKLDEGQTKEQILAYFVSQYGETVLSAPTKEGFNLTAWIFPFVALIAGAGVVYVVLSRWVMKPKPLEETSLAPVPAEAMDEYEERFRHELERYEGRD